MATVGTRGFTVIELMLFLGITGTLFAALMIGANNTIVQQRYKESVLNYATLIQNQYSEVLNTRNDRPNNWSCIDGVVNPEAVNGQFRGTSDCVLLGKAIEITNDGRTIETTTVVGYKPSAGDEPQGDIETLDSYAPKVPDDFDTRAIEMDWGTTLTLASSQDVSTASFLILRSPTSGLVRVFASANPLPNDLTEMISADTAVIAITNCVRGDSGLLPTQSVTIDARIASPNGVIIKEMDEACA